MVVHQFDGQEFYQHDRPWERQQLPKAIAILRELLVPGTTFELDTKFATDLMVVRVIGGSRKGQPVSAVAIRIRRPNFGGRDGLAGPGFYHPQWWAQFTFRALRESGVETEQEKILGREYGDWFFYGHIERDQLRHWMVLELSILREYLRVDGSHHPGVRSGLQSNNDGTWFRWFDIRSFPDRVRVAASDTIKRALVDGIESVERLGVEKKEELPPLHGRAPDLQELVARHGGYDKITAQAWAEHDRAMAEWQQRRRTLPADSAVDERGQATVLNPEALCICGLAGVYWQRCKGSGRIIWRCEEHHDRWPDYADDVPLKRTAEP